MNTNINNTDDIRIITYQEYLKYSRYMSIYALSNNDIYQEYIDFLNRFGGKYKYIRDIRDRGGRYFQIRLLDDTPICSVTSATIFINYEAFNETKYSIPYFIKDFLINKQKLLQIDEISSVRIRIQDDGGYDNEDFYNKDMYAIEIVEF